MCPELDDKFVMGKMLAEKVLFRRVPSRELDERKNSEDFWQLISCNKAGSCLLELKCNGMARWGVRSQVKFANRHMETNAEENEEAEEEENDEEIDGCRQNDVGKRCSLRVVPMGKKAKLENQCQINETRKKNCKQIGRWSAERYYN